MDVLKRVRNEKYWKALTVEDGFTEVASQHTCYMVLPVMEFLTKQNIPLIPTYIIYLI
jgi:hypothetical protein